MSGMDIEPNNDDAINNNRTQGFFLKKRYRPSQTDDMTDMLKMQKMCFIYSALEKGWTIKKRNRYYVFKKKHGDNEEIFMESYLADFINEHTA